MKMLALGMKVFEHQPTYTCYQFALRIFDIKK